MREALKARPGGAAVTRVLAAVTRVLAAVTRSASASAARALVSAAVLAAFAASGCYHRIVNTDTALPADYGLFLFSYRLSKCPAPGYLPPRDAAVTETDERGEKHETTIEAGYLDGPYCHDFLKYEMYTGTRQGTEPIYLHVNETPACSLFVAVPVERLCVGVPLSRCATYQSALNITGRFLKLALGPVSGTIQENSLNVTGFTEPAEFRDWCVRRIHEKFQSTISPEFVAPPEKVRLKPNAQ